MIRGKSQLAIRLEDALERDERTGDAQIEVMDDNGVVTLTGFAPDDETRQAAGAIAKGLSGVTTVINDIELGHEDIDQGPPILIPPPMNNSNR
jgi:osmotically-inducible protein OsmY